MSNQKEEDIRQSIRTLVQNHENAVPKEVGSKYFDETLDQNLGLDSIGYLRYEQKGGHWALKKSERGLSHSKRFATYTSIFAKRLECESPLSLFLSAP